MSKEKEPVVMICHRHWIHFTKSVLLDVLLALFAIAYFATKHFMVGAVLLLLVVIDSVSIYLKCRFDYLELTATKITEHRGFIRSYTKSTPLTHIQNISYGNGLLGKLFKYHHITIDNAGTGGTEFNWSHMANAKEFVEKTQELIG